MAIAVIAVHSPLVAVAQEQIEEDATGRTIEEVIVTATKREANMQDVAQSITAFTTDDLERLRARDMKEYIDALPSVALVNSVPGRNSVVFRGVSTGSSEYRTDSMTAVYLDEQPLTTNSQQVDPWLVDIARVEALPGPQGTLFGSSSQSGTLRVITNKPDPSGFGAQVDASAYSTRGGEPSYDLSGHVNIPVADRFAVRVAAFTSQEGGYVDNVLGRDLADTRDNADVVEDDFNEYEVSGGRVAASWELGDRW
ncbi:MAG: TonB-dependent receptor plug domain-containing protein, partial [Gammaproteobacteria bacterium]|nr:TonB-dependent receptor plug domain-containing protein [Gammaproteobacteria bacterium]